MKLTKFVLLSAAVFAATLSVAQKQTRAEYIERYKAIAVQHMEYYGIPASIKMAQGILESESGNSRLAREANNHFGIKCKTGWDGLKIYHDDDEKGECFRGYETAEDSWQDHSDFLNTGQRYQFLFDLPPTDYKAWAQGLKDAGYATNPRYPELLIQVIEENKLYLLDSGRDIPVEELPAVVAAPGAVHTAVDPDDFQIAMHTHVGYEIFANNGSRFVVAAEGDDVARLAWLFDISARRLRRFNDLGKTGEIAAGDMVYLQSKNTLSDGRTVLHTVVEGDTLYSLAQFYGIKLKSLASVNRLPAGAPLFVGQQIKLR